MYACDHGHDEMVRLLLENGADPNTEIGMFMCANKHLTCDHPHGNFNGVMQEYPQKGTNVWYMC